MKNKGPLFIGPVDSEGNFMSWNPILNVYESEETGQVFDPFIMEFVEEYNEFLDIEDNYTDEDDYYEEEIEDDQFFYEMCEYEEEQRRIEQIEYERQQMAIFAFILYEEGEFN